MTIEQEQLLVCLDKTLGEMNRLSGLAKEYAEKLQATKAATLEDKELIEEKLRILGVKSLGLRENPINLPSLMQ